MWAVTPSFEFVSQPIAELVSDQPSRTNLRPYIGQPIIYQASLPNLHAIHCLLGIDTYSNVSFCLGSRYRLTIQTYVNQDAIHPFLAVNQPCVKASIESNGTAVAIANAPLIPIGQMAVCFGYAYSPAGQLQAYAHLAKAHYGYIGPTQVPPSPSCGSGTAGLLVDVDAADAFTGDMQVIVREPTQDFGGDQTPYGNISLYAVSWHIGPFHSTSKHLQELSAAKVARAYTQVASLRSNSTNFATPVHFPYIGVQNPFLRFNVAPADCGGHAEFLSPQEFGRAPEARFAPALNGQPNSSTAYVPASDVWRSNCGFTDEQVTRMARVTVIAFNFSIGEPTSFTKTISTDSYGNNEYAASVADTSSSSWDTIHVQVLVAGQENINDPAFGLVGVTALTPLQNVSMPFALSIKVSVFATKDGARIGLVTSSSKTLTEAEAESFFNGGTVSLAGGAITVAAVGP